MLKNELVFFYYSLKEFITFAHIEEDVLFLIISVEVLFFFNSRLVIIKYSRSSIGLSFDTRKENIKSFLLLNFDLPLRDYIDYFKGYNISIMIVNLL